MKPAHKHLIVASLLATLGLAASAQTPPPAGPATGPGPMMGERMGPRHGAPDPARMKAMMDQRLAELKQKLKITVAQESAWAGWSGAMQPPANRPPRPDRDAMAKLSTPERIDKMRELRNQHMAEMDKRADATKAFYATLSPEQQKTFDAESARFMMRGHGSRGGHHGMHHKG